MHQNAGCHFYYTVKNLWETITQVQHALRAEGFDTSGIIVDVSGWQGEIKECGAVIGFPFESPISVEIYNIGTLI